MDDISLCCVNLETFEFFAGDMILLERISLEDPNAIEVTNKFQKLSSMALAFVGLGEKLSEDWHIKAYCLTHYLLAKCSLSVCLEKNQRLKLYIFKSWENRTFSERFIYEPISESSEESSSEDSSDDWTSYDGDTEETLSSVGDYGIESLYE